MCTKIIIIFACVQYPTTCGKAKVVSVVDLTVGYDSSRPPDFIPVRSGIIVCPSGLIGLCVFVVAGFAGGC